MGVCFSSGPAQHSSSLYGPHYSGSASTDCKNVGISGTTSSSTVKRQFSKNVTGSIDAEESMHRDSFRPLPLPLPPPDGQILQWPNLKVFDFVELRSATNNFRRDTVLGEGIFGSVFKGWLDEETLAPTKEGSGMVVAMKLLYRDSWQGCDEWQTELNFMGRLSHPNLVKLLGYCWDEDKRLLVYEFMSNGSLEYRLFRRNLTPLSWNTRLKIAIGAARGLAFLHASGNNVIHRDFNASNILLDGNYNPKISDFGLAKLGPSEEQSHVSTRVMGTYGYIVDPEYRATGHLSVKSDVYGFGVVLLEILTGMRAYNGKRSTGQANLVDWTKPLLSSKKKLKTIMDAKIVGQYSPKAAFQAAQLTIKCLERKPKQRPSMKEVLEGLEAIEAMHEKS